MEYLDYGQYEETGSYKITLDPEKKLLIYENSNLKPNKKIKVGKKATLNAKKKIGRVETSDDTIVSVSARGKKIKIKGQGKRSVVNEIFVFIVNFIFFKYLNY